VTRLPPCETVGARELCRILGVSEVTLGDWVRKGLPKVARGRYDLAAVVQFLLRRRDLRVQREAAELPLKVRLINERAEALRIENRRFHRAHVPVAEANDALAFFAATVERELTALVEESPSAIAGAQTVPAIQDRLFLATRRARTRIADAMDGYEVPE
jgi:hypothetical protein